MYRHSIQLFLSSIIIYIIYVYLLSYRYTHNIYNLFLIIIIKNYIMLLHLKNIFLKRYHSK